MSGRIGIIGGSGLYRMEGLEILDELDLETPFGKPSAPLVLARKGALEAVFLPRHGPRHTIPPHRINYRANIYALKLAGVTRIVSVSAVGSLREDIRPGDFVLVDQFVDRTRDRASTFFDGPIVAHVSMADPTCAGLRDALARACRANGIRVHEQGTYLAMQGPQFSTRAESRLYRQWGMDVIGMTNMPEAKLAREAEMCYATVAMCTDYDCWHESEEDVSVESVIAQMQANVRHAGAMLQTFLESADPDADCACRHALETGVLTELKGVGDEAIRPVFAILERHL